MIAVPPGYKDEVLTLLRSTLDGRPVVQEGALVLEAGAGLGVVTETLLDAAALVVACEPQPAMFTDLLARNAFRSHLRALPVAVGPAGAPDTLTLQLGKEPWNASASGPPYEWPAGELVVPQAPLPELMRQHHCNMLVLDVEGAECALLAHTSSLPSDVHTVVVEWHPMVVGAKAVAAARQVLMGLFREVATTPSWGHQAWWGVYFR